ncbi:hypothetical protein GQX73_g883 [Xylaria multiplex]|uniref:Zn(2)-C6 fungal-type domain-containing protein n=1 Tax=Xylaria multiplex TaxID=323545 RepID=A0A7C8J1A7_9PEZI|nr:hypothetical protein GQX73_g883 [Xylaria multiplex]
MPQQQQPPRSQGNPPNRKKGTACSRCRSQKIRCDNGQDHCTNCVKANQICTRPSTLANDSAALAHIERLEARLRSLENSAYQTATAAPPLRAYDGPDSPAVPSDLVASVSQEATLPSRASLSRSSSTSSEVFSPSWTGDGQEPPAKRSDYAVPPPQSRYQQQQQSVHRAVPHNTAPATTTQIMPSEPLAHDVGLLSLANSTGSKYLGPSSGVPFARLILSAVPQSRQAPTSLASVEDTDQAQHLQAAPFPNDWTFDVDFMHFIDAYFDTHQTFYPFLDEDTIMHLLEALFLEESSGLHTLHLPRLADFDKALSPLHSVQLFLVIALGARVLEPRLSVDFSAQRYLATALSRVHNISLHESVEGLQIMLLLTLCSFYFVDGPNAWYLTANVIAACLDLGLQRQWSEARPGLSPHEMSLLRARERVRKGVFWSAYSLERTLAVVLGRPLTLRDEAIDVDFPNMDHQRSDSAASLPPDSASTLSEHNTKRLKLDSDLPRYPPSHYSFRFDQLIAEMKLMLYRVRNTPNRFPWLIDTSIWQADTHQRCEALVESLERDLKWRKPMRNSSDATIRNLKLKYHHCLMLLHRPSPAIPQPSLKSWKVCYGSAIQTCLISADLNRFSKLNNTWLTAHSIFVSGMTFLYCLWVKPEIKQETTLATFQHNTAACTCLLQTLSKEWSVAVSALEKFKRLVQLTVDSWDVVENSGISNEQVTAGHWLMSLNQPNTNFRPNSLPDENDGHSYNYLPNRGYTYESQFFYNELGDMSSWFDLNWMIGEDQDFRTSFNDFS